MVVLHFFFGLVLLVGGAEALVRGAVRLGRSVGISSLVIGLTVVAFGTSAPELAVSVRAALSGPAGSDIALGNVVGSNIFNVLFILGISAMITPLVVSQRLVRVEVPIMIATSVLLLVVGIDGRISRPEGAALFAGFIVYTAFAVLKGRTDDPSVAADYTAEFGTTIRGVGPVALHVLLIVAGLAMLVLGSRWMVDGAVALAAAMGVGDLVIGLTIVAAGTSLPEVATSIVAAFKGERDIAVGNVIGSNIFNVLAVLGLSALAARDLTVSAETLQLHLPVMMAVAAACLPIFFTGGRIARLEGLLFFGFYLLYTGYLIVGASHPAAEPSYRSVVLYLVVPLTALTIGITVLHQVVTARPRPDPSKTQAP